MGNNYCQGCSDKPLKPKSKQYARLRRAFRNVASVALDGAEAASAERRASVQAVLEDLAGAMRALTKAAKGAAHGDD